jgi:hypothetical protein
VELDLSEIAKLAGNSGVNLVDNADSGSRQRIEKRVA